GLDVRSLRRIRGRMTRRRSNQVMRSSAKTILLWVLLIVGVFALWHFLTTSPTEVKEIPFSTFLSKLDKKEIKSVKVKEQDYSGKYVDGTDFSTRGPLVLGTHLIDRTTKGVTE